MHASSLPDNYQESVCEPSSQDEHERQDNCSQHIDDECDSDISNLDILSALDKVCKFEMVKESWESGKCSTQVRKVVRNVRSSPQRKKQWLEEVKLSQCSSQNPDQDINAENATLMLILDVKTRWSSTHDMLGKDRE